MAILSEVSQTEYVRQRHNLLIWKKGIKEIKLGLRSFNAAWLEKCPGLNVNEIQIPYDEHHKVSSLVKSHQNTRNSVKYEVV